MGGEEEKEVEESTLVEEEMKAQANPFNPRYETLT